MKIMIVDDEVIIRTGLAQVIKWEQYGLVLLEPAASGEEALERIPRERPHILLTDIQMSGMNGLQLAEEAKRILPELEVVILSGYDDFAYTQQAIRQQVGDYLLKTSRPDEIVKTMLAAKQRIEEKWTAISQDFHKNKEARNRLFERLVMSGNTAGSDMELMSSVLPRIWKTRSPDSIYQVWIVCAEGWEESHKTELLLFAVDNMLNELLECESLVQKDRIVVVVRGHRSWNSCLPARSMLDKIERLLKCSLRVAGGTVATEPGQLHTSYEAAADAIRYKGLLDRPVWDYDDIKDRKGGMKLCSQEEEQDLISILLQNDPVALRSWVQHYLHARVEDPETTVETLEASLQSAQSCGIRWLQRVLAMTGREGSLDGSAEYLESVSSGVPKEDLFRYLHGVMKFYHNRMAPGQATHVQKAMAYIEEHLEGDVGLQNVARHVHLHPSHLSEVFKKETGTTFGDYVIRQKIARAKELLTTSPAKISEIASRLGYEDIKYFGQLFKRYTGKTPSDYRSETLPPGGRN